MPRDPEQVDDTRTPGADPAERLLAEHQVILAVLDALDEGAAQLRGEGRIEPGFWRDALDFLHGFVELTHIAKEEQVLFPAMVAHGFPRSPGPIAATSADHDDELELLEQLRAALAAGDAPVLARSARTYADFVRQHIAREDNVLLLIARQVLLTDSARATCGALAEFDALQIGADEIARLERLARRLCSATGVVFDRERHPPFDGHCTHS